MKQLVRGAQVVLLFAAVMLAGCAYSLGKLPPYNRYVGQVVTLKEPMVLIRDSEASAYSHLQLVRPSETQPDRIPSTWTVVSQLNVGSSFLLRKVKWIRTDNAGGWILAVCEFPKDQFRGKAFTYYWGDETLNRAPWEDPSTPAERYVGSHGREYQGG